MMLGGAIKDRIKKKLIKYPNTNNDTPYVYTAATTV
jgi:hypothetical protein